MITSLLTSLMRVSIFWYVVGALVLFIGSPDWAEALYRRLMLYPGIPKIELHGLGTAAQVQLALLTYWTVPVLCFSAVTTLVGWGIAEGKVRLTQQKRVEGLKPSGKFWGVFVAGYSLGALPQSTTPPLKGQKVCFSDAPGAPDATVVTVQGAMKEALKMLTQPERQLCEELIQLLLADPNHFAGLGHGVGLLEHTLNVVTEAAVKCTPEFRMPLLAALAHDIGKLITFQPDGKGGWTRRGLHSRESARILATLPGFQALPEMHQRALILAVKYDHAPSKMPALRGEAEASQLAMRTISALSQADRSATAGEKERNLEKLQPEDLLWQDFVDFLREAPVVQRGKKGTANQVNNPPESPFLFIYEAPWRDAAVHRLPAEVAAALDLTRRDSGKLAKYTRILVERLKKEGLLVEEHVVRNKDTKEDETLKVSDSNPLWDIQSGSGEKAVVLRGILVLHAEALWKKTNYRLGVKSPYPVQILAPNANAHGAINQAPEADRSAPYVPEVTDGLKLENVDSASAMSALGLTTDPTSAAPAPTRARGRFKDPAPSQETYQTLGLSDTKKTASRKIDTPVPTPAPTPAERSEEPALTQVVAELERQEPDEPALADSTALSEEDLAQAFAAEFEASMANDQNMADGDESVAAGNEGGASMDAALSFFTQAPTMGSEEQPSTPETVTPARVAENPVVRDDAPQKPSPKKESGKKPAPAEERSVQKPAKPATAPSAADVGEPSTTELELSRAERREGLALATPEVCAQFPHLNPGDKYYTEHSRAVQAGIKKPGSRYKGDTKTATLALSEKGPSRARRKIT